MSTGAVRRTCLRRIFIIDIIIVALHGDAVDIDATPHVWQRGTPQHDRAYSISVADTDDVYIVGRSAGSMDGESGSGDHDMILIKYDRWGTWQWTRQRGTPQYDVARDVATSGEGGGMVYAVGDARGGLDGEPFRGNTDMVLIKWNRQGMHQWTRQRGTSGHDTARAVAIVGSGASQRIYVAGSVTEPMDSEVHSTGGGGSTNTCLLQYDSGGLWYWTRLRGPSLGSAEANAVVADSSDGIYIAGFTTDSVDSEPYQGGKDILVVKYNSAGSWQWTRLRSWGGVEEASGITADSDDYIYVAGSRDSDLVLFKYDKSGYLQWGIQHGSSSYDVAHRIVYAKSFNAIFMAASTRGSLDGHPNRGMLDTAVLKFDTTGVWQWTETHGSPKEDVVYGIGVDSTNAITMAGHTTGDLGGTNAGGEDVFFLKYSAITTSTTVKTSTTAIMGTTITTSTSTGAIIASTTDIVLKGFLIIEITNATQFLGEPNVAVAMSLVVAEIMNVSATWIRDVKVSRQLNRRMGPMAPQAVVQETTRQPVRISFRCATPLDGGPLQLTAVVLKSRFDSRDKDEMTRIVDRIVKSQVLRSKYDAVVRIKIIDLPDEAPSPSPSPQNSLGNRRLPIVIGIFLSIAVAFVCFIGILQVYLRSKRKRRRLIRHRNEGDKCGESALSSKSLSELLQPPAAIDANCKTFIFSLLSELIAGSNASTTQVFVTFAMDQRAQDVKDSGPGAFYAAAVLKVLLEKQQVSCYTSCLQSLSEEGSCCSMLVILETGALYKDRKCLKDIYAALVRGMEIFRLRFDATIPDDGWSQLASCDSEGFRMATVVQEKLALVFPWPQAPHTAQSQPGTLESFAVDVRYKLQASQTSAERDSPQSTGIGRSMDSDSSPSASLSARVLRSIKNKSVSSREAGYAPLNDPEPREKRKESPMVSIGSASETPANKTNANRPLSPSAWSSSVPLASGASEKESLRSGTSAASPRSDNQGTAYHDITAQSKGSASPGSGSSSASLGHLPCPLPTPENLLVNDSTQPNSKSNKSKHSDKSRAFPVANGAVKQESISSGTMAASPRNGNQMKPVRNIKADKSKHQHRSASSPMGNGAIRKESISNGTKAASPRLGNQGKTYHDITAQPKRCFDLLDLPPDCTGPSASLGHSPRDPLAPADLPSNGPVQSGGKSNKSKHKPRKTSSALLSGSTKKESINSDTKAASPRRGNQGKTYHDITAQPNGSASPRSSACLTSLKHSPRSPHSLGELPATQCTHPGSKSNKSNHSHPSRTSPLESGATEKKSVDNNTKVASPRDGNQRKGDFDIKAQPKRSPSPRIRDRADI